MKAIIIPFILFCNFCFGQKEFNDDSCRLAGTVLTVDTGYVVGNVKIDTIPTILLYVEDSKRKLNRDCKWIHGYEVRVSSFPASTSYYLDGRKRRLPKNIIVFMSIN